MLATVIAGGRVGVRSGVRPARASLGSGQASLYPIGSSRQSSSNHAAATPRRRLRPCAASSCARCGAALGVPISDPRSLGACRAHSPSQRTTPSPHRASTSLARARTQVSSEPEAVKSSERKQPAAEPGPAPPPIKAEPTAPRTWLDFERTWKALRVSARPAPPRPAPPRPAPPRPARAVGFVADWAPEVVARVRCRSRRCNHALCCCNDAPCYCNLLCAVATMSRTVATMCWLQRCAVATMRCAVATMRCVALLQRCAVLLYHALCGCNHVSRRVATRGSHMRLRVARLCQAAACCAGD
jgi:hypothetical protein